MAGIKGKSGGSREGAGRPPGSAPQAGIRIAATTEEVVLIIKHLTPRERTQAMLQQIYFPVPLQETQDTDVA
jgi:hypothetical protein